MSFYCSNSECSHPQQLGSLISSVTAQAMLNYWPNSVWRRWFLLEFRSRSSSNGAIQSILSSCGSHGFWLVQIIRPAMAYLRTNFTISILQRGALDGSWVVHGQDSTITRIWFTLTRKDLEIGLNIWTIWHYWTRMHFKLTTLFLCMVTILHISMPWTPTKVWKILSRAQRRFIQISN